MSPNCVNVSNPAFKQLAKDLNVSERSLELLAHEYNIIEQDQEGKAYLTEKGRNWLNEKLNGVSQKALPNTIKLWEDKYSTPQVIENAEEANAAYAEAVTYFGPKATVLKETYDGKYELKIAEPIAATHDVEGYEHRSNIEQALGIVERAKEAYLAAKTLKEIRAVEARFNQHLAEVLSPEVKVSFGNHGLMYAGNTKNLTLLNDMAQLEEPATKEELNTLFSTLSSKFGKPFRIVKGKGLHVIDRGDFYEVQVQSDHLPSYTQLAEEMLHPLVEAIQVTNPELFRSFLNEVKNTKDRKLKVIRDGIYRAYEDKSYSEQDNEIVTQALAYHLKNAKENKSSAFQKIIKAIVNWLIEHGLLTKAPAEFSLKRLAYILKFENIQFNLSQMQRTYEHRVFNERQELSPSARESIVETFAGYWTREQVAAQTDKVFLFGDNTEDRTVTHYVPSSTQAVIRGLPNAIGIDTKKDRKTSESSYFTDADFDQFKVQVDDAIAQAKASGKIIVIPADGIGTGKAMLAEKAPKCFKYLQNALEELRHYTPKVEEASMHREQEVRWSRYAADNYEVSSAGDSRFSAMEARFAEGTTIFGHDVSGRTIESVYQHGVKQGDWSTDNNHKTGVPKSKDIIKGDNEDASFEEGYLPLWQEWAKQNPELIQELAEKAAGKTLTDKFASSRVSQARALSIILNAHSANVVQETVSESIQKANERAEIVRKYLADQQRFYNEIKAIQDSGRLSNMEVRKVAADVAYAVSDLITQVQKGEIDINQLIPGKETKKPVAEMSRAEILQFIGVYTPGETFDTDSGAFAYVRRTYFGDLSKMKGTGEELRANRRAAVVINQNFRAIVELAAEEMVNVEGFGLRVVEGRPAEVIEGMNINVDDYNNDEDAVAILEREGDLQEHWQVNFRTLDVLGSMSQIVRQALLQCYKLDSNGNPIENRFGIKERVSAREATSQILRWTQGAIDMKTMIDKLKEHEESSPWITQIIQRLTKENKSDAEYGSDTDFRSQFYNVFSKHFQLYTSIIEDANHKYYSAPSNERPVLKGMIEELQAAIATDQVPMFQGGRIDEEVLAKFKHFLDLLPNLTEQQFKEMTPEQVEDAQDNIWVLLREFGAGSITSEQIQDSWNYDVYKKVQSALYHIGDTLTKHVQDETYDPMAFEGGIKNNLKIAIGSLISNLEDVAVSSFYDNGKTYQSYVTPSYLTKFLQKMRLQGEEFETFIENEFGQYDWFKDSKGNWKNPWIADIVQGHLKSGQKCGNIPYSELFAHKVELNFDKHDYMRKMSPAEYALSILAEFFTASDSKESTVPAWYRVTMLSNKPSAEYIRFKRYADLSTYKENVLNDLMQVFAQELGRIKTTKARNEVYDKKSLEYIKNLDKNGRKFSFLPYLNDATGRLKELIDRKTNPHGEALSTGEEGELNKLAREAIKDHMTKRAGEIIAKWEKNGVAEAATKIKGLNKTNVRVQLENFIWNDTLASMMIDEIFITDRALYKNTEDLQKRMAQIHAPGVRGDVNAVDYDGHKVSADGIYRAVLLKDFDSFKSNVIDNLREVFNRRELGLSGEDLNAARALHSNIIKQYENINVADAQAYSSITSRRKKDFIMGLWSREKESLYNKIKKHNYSDADLATMFTIMNACEVEKPFCYSQIKKSTNVPNGMANYKVGVQFKNSEYLLIMADAILEGEDTTKPNLLRAINRFMEMSASRKDGKGIDTVQFESAAKGLNQGALNLAQFLDVKDGEQLAYQALNEAAYVDAQMQHYNNSVVHEIPFEDWCIQQPVPNHFYDHAQQQGSQGRMIVTSDLADTFNGEPVEFEVYGEKYTAREIRKEYEQNAADNIEASLEDVNEELGLNLVDRKERNIAIAKILQREIKSSPRYGTDLLKACTLDANGEFIIPLSDPIQAKRIEQLLNSIIKNRVNKQEIAGGPVVQVSNFGTSDELNIRFQDKQGNLLPTKKEFEKLHPGESYKDYIAKNQGKLAYFEVYVSRFEGVEKYEREDGTVDMERIEKECPELLDLICSRIPTEDKYSMIPCRIKGFLPKFAGAGIMMPADITAITGCDFDVDKMYIMRKQFLKDENGNYVFPHDKTTTIGRNNRNVEMMRVILTHESNLDKLFNPGGFEPQKKVGYMVQAYKQGAADWQTLQDIADNKTQAVEQEDGTFEFQPYDTKAVKDGDALGGVDALKALSYQASDISFIDTQIQFYEQNSAAASILGIFAVAKVAHATLENNKFGLVLNGMEDQGIGLMHPATIGSLTLGVPGDMTIELDPTKNTQGQYIGKDLGSLVASAADAVKDPVLNLMNINKETVNVLNTLIRLGMPFNEAALFLSQQVITDVIQQYYKERIDKPITLSDMVEHRLSKFDQEGIYPVGDADQVELTMEDLVKGLKDTEDTKRVFQTLYMFDKVMSMANALNGINFLTRFNSIANAVGPLVIDNIVKEDKLEPFHYSQIVHIREDGYREKNDIVKTVFAMHPILAQFRGTLEVARKVFADMPEYKTLFKNALTERNIGLDKVVFGNRNTLNKYSDFFKSAMLVSNGTIDISETDYFVNSYAKDFIAIKQRETLKDNLLIQAIRVAKDAAGSLYLKVDSGVLNDPTLKGNLSAAWADLLMLDEKVALDLFKYNFFRGGIGFTPRTFMNLVPLEVKEAFPGYIETYRRGVPEYLPNLGRMFVQNNWRDNRLAPTRDLKNSQGNNMYVIHTGGVLEVKVSLCNAPYFKMQDSEKNFHLYEKIYSKGFTEVNVYREIPILGGNGEFINFYTTPTYTPVQKVALESMAAMESSVPNSTQEDMYLVDQETAEYTSEFTKRNQEYVDTQKAMEGLNLLGYTTKVETTGSVEQGTLDVLKARGVEVKTEDVEKTIDDKNIC